MCGRQDAGETPLAQKEAIMRPLSRDARLLQYFAQRAPGGTLGVTRIQKLAYLADLVARGYLGRPLSEFDYRWHNHGPFDGAIYNALDELRQAGLATEKPKLLPWGRRFREISCTGTVPDLGFSDVERAVLDYVADRFARMDLDQLLREVYETGPMVVAQAEMNRGVRLPMDRVNFQMKDAQGVDLEAVVAAERSARLGNTVPADDFFDALQVNARKWDSAVN